MTSRSEELPLLAPLPSSAVRVRPEEITVGGTYLHRHAGDVTVVAVIPGARFCQVVVGEPRAACVDMLYKLVL